MLVAVVTVVHCTYSWQCSERYVLLWCCQHVKINHENAKPHTCPVCQKGFPYASYLAEHMPVHDVPGEERRYACEHCTKTFMRASGLRKHTKEEHLVGPKPYVCSHCDRRYAYRCALEGHMRRHSAVRPFSCQTCSARFKHISNLQKHVKVSRLAQSIWVSVLMLRVCRYVLTVYLTV